MNDIIRVTVHVHWNFYVTPAVKAWIDIPDEGTKVLVGEAMQGDDRVNLRAYLKFASRCREKLDDGMNGYKGHAILIPKK